MGIVRAWLGTALEARVVARALKYSLVVGTVLIAINHGDAIVTSQVTATAFVKMVLTMFVPYVVSTLSSVAAIRELRAEK